VVLAFRLFLAELAIDLTSLNTKRPLWRRPSVVGREKELVIETYVDPGSSIVCKPWGRLDWVGATCLRHVINDSLRPGIEVIIDLSHVDWVDAVGMSALLGSVRRVRAIGSRVLVCNIHPAVRRRLELVGIYRDLIYCPTPGNDVA
jgi:stage II sporulation protein AA (anti-sigma F factor antagonist)